MEKTHLSGQQGTEHTQTPPTSNIDSLKISRIKASKAALLVGAGAVAVVVPVAILSLILFLIGA